VIVPRGPSPIRRGLQEEWGRPEKTGSAWARIGERPQPCHRFRRAH
jgi:hypothetical protein